MHLRKTYPETIIFLYAVSSDVCLRLWIVLRFVTLLPFKLPVCLYFDRRCLCVEVGLQTAVQQLVVDFSIPV